VAESFIAALARAPGVVIIASAQGQPTLHAALGAAHVFKKVVALRAPDKDARRQILDQVLKSRLSAADGLALDAVRAPNVVALATETEGYSATDLKDLVGRAVHQAAVRTARRAEDDGDDTVRVPVFCALGQDPNARRRRH
jgi:peroxin-1